MQFDSNWNAIFELTDPTYDEEIKKLISNK